MNDEMNKEEEKKEEENNNSNFGELNMFNKIFKNTQKNVGIDFMDANCKFKESQKNIKNNESFNLSKYKEYLMKKVSKISKFLKKIQTIY